MNGSTAASSGEASDRAATTFQETGQWSRAPDDAALLRTLVPHATGHRARAGGPTLVRNVGLHLVYALAVSVMVAYVTGRSVEPGADYKAVFRMAASAGILAHAFGHFAGASWGTRTWEGAGKEAFDGLVYGLLTGGPFGWLWPEA